MAKQRAARRLRGFSPIDAGFFIGAVTLVVVGVLGFRNTGRLRTEEEWVAHTYEVLAHLDRVEIQSRALKRASDPATISELALLREATADNVLQQSRLDTLRALVDGPVTPVLALVARMQSEERELLAGRIARADDVASRSETIIAFSTVLAIVLMAIALTLLHRDLGVRRAAELALQDSESRHRLLMEQAADAILIVDSEAVCVEANARATEIVGRPRSEIIGLPLKAFVRGEKPGSTAGLPMLRYGQVTTGEFWVTRPDGSRVPVEIRATLLDDGRVQIIARDISERKEVDRLKGEFVSMVSHELRTPLSSIRGALGLLASGKLDSDPEKRRRMRELAVANTDRLIRLINDILDVERINSNAATFEQTSCSVRELVEQVVETIAPLAERAGTTVHWEAADVHIWADPDRITQTLMNLVDNAIKFSPAGSTVHVSVRADETFATFAVGDQGRGIPADKLASVFDRFQQVDASDSREKGGSGLGLAISRGIVEQHGGKMWVESVLGVGSTFLFTIPLVANQGATTGDSSAPLVLVCDDDVDLLVVLRATLEQRGYRVVTAQRGREAIQRFDAGGADLVIIDSMLADVSGIKVLRHVNAASTNTRTIVYTAAYLESAERDFVRATGAVIVTKSKMSPEQLTDEVQRLIGSADAPLKHQEA
ncbi:MAG: domain S-box [Gemmatimonadetes bacterium]|nr:domain S-box [Gemmatimonadota bacterium]